jgi:hypothetical protein
MKLSSVTLVCLAFLLTGCGGSGMGGSLQPGFYKGFVTTSLASGPVPVAFTVGTDRSVSGYAFAPGTEISIVPTDGVPGSTTTTIDGDESPGKLAFSGGSGVFSVTFTVPGQPGRGLTGSVTAAALPTVGAPGTPPAGTYSGDYVLLLGAVIQDYGTATATIDGSGHITMSFVGANVFDFDPVPAVGTLAPNGVLTNASIHLFTVDYPQTDATYGFANGTLTVGMNQIALTGTQLRVTMTLQ